MMILRSCRGKELSRIQSGRAGQGTVGLPGVGTFAAESFYRDAFRAQVPAGQERTMLLDVASLTVVNPPGMEDIPAGDYLVTVRFNDFNVESNSCKIHLVEPSPAEQHFLKVASLLARQETRSRLNWSKFFVAGTDLSQLNQHQLSRAAKQQLQFHVLLSQILHHELTPTQSDIKRLRSVKVPPYLRAEKDALLLEVRLLTKEENHALVIKKFIERHPDLRWRMEAVEMGKKDLLTFKRIPAPNRPINSVP